MQPRLAAIRAAFPSEGLFAEKEWLLSPEPFSITPRQHEELQKLGYRLLLFQRACNELYFRSIKAKAPAWIADYVDRGKPAELIELGRRKETRADLPTVIRPDLVVTEEGYAIAEIDTVPGGIGVTAWLNQTYSRFGTYDVIGGERAIDDFPHHPWILQKFHHARVLEHPYFDPATSEEQKMRGRARLCPYYFVREGKAVLSGALATIVPSDKKILHGMKDAILVPTVVGAE
ncbi:MAG TPA: hypothetical protein VFG14_21115 [Chthoniobacteraceae bacterium]|nr:hypothetical protein [Chthoniobacteraceae bacterium]